MLSVLAQNWWILALRAVAAILFGLAAFIWPDITALALLIIIGTRAIMSSVLEIMAAIRLRHFIDDEWLLSLSGFASLVFGLAIIVRPDAGALAVVWIIGAYALVFGALLLALALRLRSLEGQGVRPGHGHVPHPA